MYKINVEKLVDTEKAKREAEKLYKAGEKKWGTDEETFIRIFANREFYQMRKTYDEYVMVCLVFLCSKNLKIGILQTNIYSLAINFHEFHEDEIK